MKRLFMPGCSLSAYSPALTATTGAYLKKYFPDMAVMHTCCAKPTKLIGQNDLFRKRLGRLEADIKRCKVEQVISACPGCVQTLSGINDVQIASLWEILCEIGLPDQAAGKAKDTGAVFSVHDPCAARGDLKAHESVRRILKELGYPVALSHNDGVHTLCCGQGGMVGVSNQTLSAAAARRCIQGFPTKHILTYCASCRGAFAANGAMAWHILDLIWGRVVTQEDGQSENVPSGPLQSWKNRLAAIKLIKKL